MVIKLPCLTNLKLHEIIGSLQYNGHKKSRRVEQMNMPSSFLYSYSHNTSVPTLTTTSGAYLSWYHIHVKTLTPLAGSNRDHSQWSTPNFKCL